MAIYHFDASVISRSKGRSATAASAYRAAERVVDRRTGEVHDYTRKHGVEHTEILAPEHAPDWARDRSALWNAVEQIERRKDAQVSREVRVALPSELTAEQNRDLVRGFVQAQFVSRGMVADIALHAPGREGDQRNHHAHIMLTTREIGPEGFGAKNRDWNAKEVLVDWRSSWAEHVNQTLERCNVHERVDHRTLEAQREEALERASVAERNGDERVHVAEMARAVELDRPPLPDVGARGWSMMRRGIATPASDRWQEVREIGLQVREVAREFQTQAREWLERTLDRVQERAAALGLARAPETALERLQAARASRGAMDAPQTALERLQAARAVRGQDRGVEVARNVESAGHALTQQDRERERMLEQERAVERQRAAERKGPSHER
ncbi:MobQ family relaxase [Paracoccus hibiscisoli]|uniref:MobA/MobL family protein n=1 Tax=Paracoccus hibiscisoli TaxID=2023261 RepID=A0A4U0QBN4_9RHOB|nr:MobQ family relaxase [Paracoccus hibiscisoli]TJZ78696.1 MobA/MobL family protein [Paracoccus hibiscisoli]